MVEHQLPRAIAKDEEIGRGRRGLEFLVVDVGPLDYTEEKRDLLERFLDERHAGPMTADEEAVLQSLLPGILTLVRYLKKD